MEAVGQMAGGMAHEFNNLLTAIGGFARMAMRRPDDAERVRDCIDEVVRASDRAADLTQQMLAYGRKQVLEPKVVRIGDIVGELQSMLRPVLGELIQIHTDIADDGVRVLADPTQLSQVIVNLAINASDAMPDGGDLTIGSAVASVSSEFATDHAGGASGRYASVFVEDTGCGMDDETQRKIFEPFFTTKEPGSGTGLGLSVVYGIVQQSGGIIDVQSTPGAGSRFTVYLPVHEGAPDDAAVDEDRDEGPAVGRASTILVVEDEHAVRRLVQQELEAQGHKVLTAANGKEALRVQRDYDGPIDLLVTDVVMPQMGGVETARALSAARPGIRVIYMSGYRDRGGSENPGLGDEAIVLQKPFGDRVLHEAVRQALEGTAEPNAPSPVLEPPHRLQRQVTQTELGDPSWL
jgi:CheY-like chemotaxis protein